MATKTIQAVPTRRYEPKRPQGKYVVDGLQYPSDLMGLSNDGVEGFPYMDYGANCVFFYINVNEESRMLKNDDVATVDIGDNERIAKQLNGKNYDQKAVVAATAAAGGGLGTLLGVSGGGVGGAVIGGVGAATVAMNTKASKFSRPQKRLKTAIALHVPNQLAIRYGAGWSEEETFAMQALIDGGEAAGRALADAGKALVDKKGDQAAASIIGGAKNLSPIAASVAMSKGPMGGALSALSGLAPNPMKEQIFKGMDFRSFTMEYQFAPRSQEESDNVNNIIRTFKYHMHPEFKDATNFLFLYPSEFDIEYHHNGEENLNIHRHTSCVLTEMNINYTPLGNFSTFEGGRPTQINVSMSFKELTVLTKELIEQGL
jgi:hypothetical protein